MSDLSHWLGNGGGKKTDRISNTVVLLLALAAFLYLILEPDRFTPVIDYSVDAFYADRPTCPDDTISLEYEVVSGPGGIFANHKFIVDAENGRNLGEPEIVYRWLDPGRPVLAPYTFVVPDLPPGYYRMVNSSVRVNDTSRSDHFDLHFQIEEGCDE